MNKIIIQIDCMDHIEEKTPSGITLKVLLKKWDFIAFDKDGGVIYADESEAKVLHKVPIIIFLGENIHIVKSHDSELSFFKIVRGELVIPYTDSSSDKRRYLFIRIYKNMDLIPIRVKEIKGIDSLVRGIESDLQPNYIVIDSSITEDDCVIIKNRYPTADIIYADDESYDREIKNGRDDVHGRSQRERASDIVSKKNLNIMSNNPVFLARIHLREMDLSKVNQLLLDFDISSLEAEYMLRFIEMMLLNREGSDDIEKNRSKLSALKDAFQFYIFLVNRNKDKIDRMIEKIDSVNKLASYNTLLAKIKLLFPEDGDQLLLTEYENQLFEKKKDIIDE